MKPSDPGHELIRRYLLGQLPDPSQQSLEEGFMTGDTSLEELEASEDDLIDDYLAGRLNDDERRSFEQHFLNHPTRQQKLRFAKVFRRYAASHQSLLPHSQLNPPVRAFTLPSWPVSIGALALVVVVIGAIWSYRRSLEIPSTFSTITLSPTTRTRGEGPEVPNVRIPQDASLLRVRLLLPSDSKAEQYKVELESDAGVRIPTTLIGKGSSEVTIDVPASQLKRGQHVLKLFAVDPQGREERIPGSYFFTVE